MNERFWIIPLFPLAGFLLLGLLGKKLSTRAISLIACGSVGLSFAGALLSFQALLRVPPESRFFSHTLFTWIAAGAFQADFAFGFDPLSAVMVLLITGVGLLIHIYSIGYMHGDPGYSRFFTYLNLFLFAMLTLVMAENYLLLFVGWEGVGLCSYLLIGFWFEKPSASAAGKKAFLVNRIGDAAFLLGLFLLFSQFGTLDFRSIESAMITDPQRFPVENGVIGGLTLTALLLFAGAAGKSAQIPLFVWLPDAMEGPTPVSALIHAATMVTAGIYLVARSAALFLHAPLAMETVAVTGMLTAVFAATIALVQRDIKRVLAYSTISQLGYMFAAVGIGAFTAGMFHLVTHAFFKALLFLGAGSIIHGLGGQQDLFHMGNLRKAMPWTFAVMPAGMLAIAGFPGFSGFFSKDEILWKLFSSGHSLLWVAGLGGAVMTAFYTARLLFLAFGERQSGPAEKFHAAHESPAVMIVPLVLLAGLSVLGGWIGLPSWLGSNHLEDFLSPVFPAHMNASHEVNTHGGEITAAVLSSLLAILGIGFAALLYLSRRLDPAYLAERFPFLYRLFCHKYWVDELYQAVLVQPCLWISEHILWRYWDQDVIDGLVNGTGRMLEAAGNRLRRMQNGSVRDYAAWICTGAIFILLYLLIT